jgi:RNA polymerase sigma-70 factor (ECF subfamily)
LTLTNQNINTLLVLCKKENQLAQLEVYNRYQHAMYNTAMRIVKNTAEAEDVMQESFITAFNKLDTFKGDAAFGSWLKRIVINNSIVQYKKSKRFVNIADEDFKEEAQMDSYLETSEDYTHTKANQVLSCMNDLNDKYRQILNLHFIEGFDYEEICEIMQISYANCRTLISRAKESLRSKLIAKP